MNQQKNNLGNGQPKHTRHGIALRSVSADKAKALWDRFEFVYTPKHGSWLLPDLFLFIGEHRDPSEVVRKVSLIPCPSGLRQALQPPPPPSGRRLGRSHPACIQLVPRENMSRRKWPIPGPSSGRP
jgi:hypothetical protein